MNKTLKTILSLSIILYVIGGLFKISHWPYGQLIHLSGLILTLSIFIPLLLISKLKSKPTGRLVYYYISGFSSLVFILLGDLINKINNESKIGLYIGFIGTLILLFLFLPISIKQFKTSILPSAKKKYRNRIIFLFIYFIFLSITVIFPIVVMQKQSKSQLERFKIEADKNLLNQELESVEKSSELEN